MKGGVFGLLAALIYGASFALVKHIQEHHVHDLILAGLIYLSQATVFLIVRTLVPATPEKRIHPADTKWLLGAAVFGGCLAPILYVAGQNFVPAYAAALLAPTEILFTALIAVILFHERLNRIEGAAVLLIILGAAGIGFKLDDRLAPESQLAGAGLVLAAFLMWGIDNNCTTRIARRDPLLIAVFKGFIGGSLSLLAGLLLGGSVPVDATVLGLIAVLGVACFGISYAMLIVSMRLLGASRATALFGTHPAFAVALAWVWLREQPSAWALAGGGVVIVGVYLMLWAGTKRSSSATAPPSGTSATPG